jgi:hypothetical protein
LFDFMSMALNYEQRKIARDEFDFGFVSTCSVTDSDHLYETGVKHKNYSNSVIVVEGYDDEDAAKLGHEKWVKLMTSKDLPDSLTDVGTSEMAYLSNALDGNPAIVRKV